jgi:hypothetical protein
VGDIVRTLDLLCLVRILVVGVCIDVDVSPIFITTPTDLVEWFIQSLPCSLFLCSGLLFVIGLLLTTLGIGFLALLPLLRSVTTLAGLGARTPRVLEAILLWDVLVVNVEVPRLCLGEVSSRARVCVCVCVCVHVCVCVCVCVCMCVC